MEITFIINVLFIYVHFAFAEKLTELIRENIKKAEEWNRPLRNEDFSQTDSPPIDYGGKYDFVIIGAGSGGASLARRLTEVKKWRILLLEAGGEETEFGRIPNMYSYNLLTNTNWGYLTTPQKYSCMASNNNQCSYPRGKALGGSSSNYGMIYSRGNVLDYDRWANIVDSSWSFEKILPYFKKLERVHFRANPKYRGFEGPLSINYSIPVPAEIYSLMKGFQELGYPIIDYNGEQSLGISYTQVNIKYGRRDSVYSAYLKPVRQRKNLKIVTGALATKIIFNVDKSVKEVHFVHKNKNYFVKPNIELILAAGAINTPQLLMLSGIGPKAHLESLGIPVIADLPVGKHLQDHVMSCNSISTNLPIKYFKLEDEVEEYQKGFGRLTQVTQAVQFLQTNSSLPKNFPNIEVIYTVDNPVKEFPNLLSKSFNYKNPPANNKLINKAQDKLYPIQFCALLLHPKSTGEITLKSSTPLDYPNININAFSNPEDIEVLYNGMLKVFEVVNTKAMKRIGGALGSFKTPFCQEVDEKAQRLCFMRHFMTYGHVCSTARMGNDIKSSVVDAKLKVHGFKNLRIVDASTIPQITSGHIHAIVVMIAEKIADVIKKSYRKHS